MEYSINYWAVLVSGVAYFVLGGVWYAAIFSRQYQAALAFSEAEKTKAQRDFPKALATHLFSGLLTAYVLAHIVQMAQATNIGDGLAAGFWSWLGFAFTINLNYWMFERRPKSLVLINTGFFLIAFLISGAILSVWR